MLANKTYIVICISIHKYKHAYTKLYIRTYKHTHAHYITYGLTKQYAILIPAGRQRIGAL